MKGDDHMWKCSVCGKEYEKMGCGIRPNGDRVCFPCCGDLDRKALMDLKNGEKMYLYLSNEKVTNWPGSLVINPTRIKKGRHNIAGTRHDVWFELNGKHFHGVQYGDFSEICHITTIR